MTQEKRLLTENIALKIKLEKTEDLLDLYRKDQLTGLKMRRDFESKFTEFFQMGIKFYLVFADVNGLHNLNRDEEKGGLKAGDELIKRVALDLATTTDGLTYRIGGDEFVSLCINEPICSQSDERICAVVCSTNYETQDDMFKACDLEGIRLKDEYYKDNEHNRRK